MTPRQQGSILAGLVLAAALAAAGGMLWHLLARPPEIIVSMRVPGLDNAPADRGAGGERVELAGEFSLSGGAPSALPGDWPRFRGPDMDNIAKNAPPLADSWGPDGPDVLWTVEVGEGYAGAAVKNGRVYIIDYDEENRADVVRCLSLDDGAEIWRRAYRLVVKKNHGMTRTVPVVTENHLITIGPRCHVVCLDPLSGAFRWGLDLQRDYGAKEPMWYTGQCPMVDGSALILAPCGPEVLMMAVDCDTGTVLWKAPNPDEWRMSHASVIPMTLAGHRMYVYSAIGGVAAVSAEPESAGTLLWRIPWRAKVIAPSPVPAGDDLVFVSAGYGEGGMMIQVAREPGGVKAEILYSHKPKDGLASEQQTPIFHEGLLYGIMPKDAGALRSQFVCYHPDGTLVWSSGQENRFGLGPYLLADGKFFVLDDEGTLSTLRARPDAFEPLASAKVIGGHETWGPFALAGDRLLLRNQTQMACVFVGKAQ